MHQSTIVLDANVELYRCYKNLVVKDMNTFFRRHGLWGLYFQYLRIVHCLNVHSIKPYAIALHVGKEKLKDK